MNKVNRDECIHVLRNPYGYASEQIKTAQLDLCDEVEELERELAALHSLGGSAKGQESAAQPQVPETWIEWARVLWVQTGHPDAALLHSALAAAPKSNEEKP